MTFPRIFKRRSRKSLSELPKSESRESTPPLPTPKPETLRSQSSPLPQVVLAFSPSPSLSLPGVAPTPTANPAIPVSSSLPENAPDSNSTTSAAVPKDASHPAERNLPNAGSSNANGDSLPAKALLTVNTAFTVAGASTDQMVDAVD